MNENPTLAQASIDTDPLQAASARPSGTDVFFSSLLARLGDDVDEGGAPGFDDLERSG